MRIKEFFEWLDDFDSPTDTNWMQLVKAAIWVLFLAATITSYCVLFSVFGEPQ